MYEGIHCTVSSGTGDECLNKAPRVQAQQPGYRNCLGSITTLLHRRTYFIGASRLSSPTMRLLMLDGSNGAFLRDIKGV
eukprot:scaffold1035_cov115-Cylindrotheca_fusiformis.AAC.1